MRRLILGCGYLGRRVADLWLAAGDDVTALTRSVETAESLRAVGIEPIIGDVTDADSLTALPEADTVLHCVGFDRNAAASKRAVYVDGLNNVLQQLRGRCNRFIHVSSSSVYGHQDGETVDEASVTEPSHESGQICLAAERLVREQLDSAPATAWNILRLSGIYGPARLLARIDAIQAGRPLPGNPDAWLNLIHVDDAAAAVAKCAESGESRRIYLISDDRPVRRREYYSALARILGVEKPQFDPDTSARHTRGLNKRCRNHRLRTELALELSYPTIDEGLPSAIRET